MQTQDMYPERVGNVPEGGAEQSPAERTQAIVDTEGASEGSGQEDGPWGWGQPRGLSPGMPGVCQACLRSGTRVAGNGSASRPGGKRWQPDLPVPPPDPQQELLNRNLPGVGGKQQGLTPEGGAGQVQGEDGGQRGTCGFREVCRGLLVSAAATSPPGLFPGGFHPDVALSQARAQLGY